MSEQTADAVRDGIALVSAALMGANVEQLAHELAHAAPDAADWAGVVGAALARIYAGVLRDVHGEAAEAVWAAAVALTGPDSGTAEAKRLRDG